MDAKDFDAFMRKCMNDHVPPKNTKEYLNYSIRMTMKKEDIMTFVSGLHDVQMDMIETIVISKEKQGFPEAHAVIDHIRNLK
jgi:hypothetical protein